MANKISFKSYCWAIGTTSYRMDNFNMSIEMQLSLLKEFRELAGNKGKIWTGNNAFQAEYYEFLKTRDFVKGDAPRPDKDAREKMSGLRDIGLLDGERNITAAGEALVIAREGLSVLHKVPVLQATSEETFKEEFFRIMHLFKAKATLSDYFNLNRRYFKITDIVLFEDNRVKLDVLPKCYIENIAEHLPEFAFEETELLSKDVELKEIHPSLAIDANKLYQKLGQVLGRRVADKESARKVIKNERYARFNRLIDDRFDKDTLITLLNYFENRKDEEIRALVTDNADRRSEGGKFEMYPVAACKNVHACADRLYRG